MKITIAFALLMIPMIALGAVASQSTNKTYLLQRSGTNISPGPTSMTECVTRKAALIQKDAITKVSGSWTYKCFEIEQTTVRFKANPIPPVEPPAQKATLRWTPPTSNTDGTALTNLAGYRIYYGTSLASMTQTVQIGSPSISTFIVDGLSAATWYFAVTAITATGVESARSNIASKTIG